MRHKLTSYLASHLRVGYVSGLIFADAVFAAVFAIDLLRLRYVNGVSVAAVLEITPSRLFGPTLGPSAKLLLFLTLILPLLIAAVRVGIGAGRFAPSFLGWRGRLVRYLHWFVALLLCLSYSTVSAGQTLAGYSFDGTRADYSFHSLYEMYLVTPVSWLLSPVPTVIVILLSGLASLLPSQFKVASWLEDYLTRVLLADLNSILHPVNGRHNANFNTAAGAPEIDYVRRKAEEHLERYRTLVPGSTESGYYLLQLSEQCRGLLQELFFRTIPITHRIEFYPGTSRALEIALTRIPGKKHIIMSPYEHPTEHSVVRWHAEQTGATPERLQITGEDFALQFGQHKNVVVEKLVSALKRTTGPTVLIISEVCFSTGMTVPVKTIIEEVKNRAPKNNLHIIVDGAHAVGNSRQLLNPSAFDAYVFSAHKWLYSSEPMGILISPKGQASAYDGWGDQLPDTWASARAIAAFLSSLQMFRAHHVRFFLERSGILRKRFESTPEVSQRFQVVGMQCKDRMPYTNMLSLRPAIDYRWNGQVPSLNAFFKSRGVYPLMVDHESLGTLEQDPRDPDQITPWVRVSFPYFLDVSEVRQLASTLCSAVTKVER